jgi:raffinose/stachyose/melibiose transport system permease protein
MDWKKAKANKYYRHNELAYISLYLPALIMFLVFVVSPLLQAIYISLTDWNGLSKSFNFIGFKNYYTFFKDDYVHHSINATLKYTLTVTIFQNFLALVLALALNNAFHGRNILRAVFFVPSLMSNLIIGFIWSFLFSDPIMKFGKAVGWELLAKNILSSKDFAIFAAAFVTIWRSSGWTMMIYLAGLQNIPKELEEAAAIDGAVYLQRLRHIILPLIAPSFTINFILVFERCLKDFDSIFALTQGGPGNATLVMAINIYRESFFYSRGSYGTTIGVVMFIVIVLLTLLQLKFFRKGEQNVD